jgi:hypothetical protein
LAVLIAGAIGLAIVYYGLWTPRTRGLWSFVLRRKDDLTVCLSAFVIVAGIAATLFAVRFYRGAIYAMGLSSAALLVFFLGTAARADRYVSARAAAQYVEARYPDRQVLLYQDYERLSSLPFYLKRQVAIVDSRSNDLLFGMRHSPDDEKFVSIERVRSLARARRVVILVHRIRLKDFGQKLGKSEFVRGGRVGNVIFFVQD